MSNFIEEARKANVAGLPESLKAILDIVDQDNLKNIVKEDKIGVLDLFILVLHKLNISTDQLHLHEIDTETQAKEFMEEMSNTVEQADNAALDD